MTKTPTLIPPHVIEKARAFIAEQLRESISQIASDLAESVQAAAYQEELWGFFTEGLGEYFNDDAKVTFFNEGAEPAIVVNFDSDMHCRTFVLDLENDIDPCQFLDEDENVSNDGLAAIDALIARLTEVKADLLNRR